MASLIAVVAAVTALVTPAALASPDTGGSGELTRAQRKDIGTIAQQNHWSFETAAKRIAWQDRFAAVVRGIRADHTGSYAGAAITGRGRGAWIAFADEVPDGVAERIDGLPVPVKLIGDRGFSEEELARSLNRTYTETTSRPDVRDAVGSYDIATGKIELDVLPARTVRSGAARESALARLAPKRPANRAISVEMGLLKRPDGVTDSDMYGGGVVYLPIEGRRCTAAFTVFDRFSRREGISTAHHCASRTLRYYQHQARSYTTIERVDRKAGSSGDIAWYTPGAYEPTNEFYYAYGKLRPVRETGDPVVGQSVCNFGRTTGYKCATVYRNNVCREAGKYCGLTAVTKEVTDFGDSGGPWFLYNTAFGVHSARTSINGAVRSLFTPINKLSDLGVRVITSPCRSRVGSMCLSY